MITLALLHSTIRGDEKLIIRAAKKRNIHLKLIDIRGGVFNPHTYIADFDVALERSVSTVKGDYAIQFLEAIGVPVVIKPPAGSWGRLLAKVNDVDALEAVIEHKDVLGSPQQKAIYIQQYMKKPGRDIRAFVIDGVTICAIYRVAEHWITNTARGGVARRCSVTNELSDICQRASEAVGGGILAMDIFETGDGFMIN